MEYPAHVIGQEREKLLVWYDSKTSEGRNQRLSFWYNVLTRERSDPFPREGISGAFYYFQNNQGFASMGPEFDMHTIRVDVMTGEKNVLEDLPNSPMTFPSSLSPDKLLLLNGTGLSAGVFDTFERKYLTIQQRDFGGVFLTNELLFSMINYSTEIDLWDKELQSLESVFFSINGAAHESYTFWFTPDMKTAVMQGKSGQSYTLYILDTTPFRSWLDEQGLLFRPTTAECTESRVRVRENPNLEAQTFGHLEAGDQMEVLDRSGLKVQIGEMNDWWYKIRRKSDGLEGWAYGYFLELAEYQGELEAQLIVEQRKRDENIDRH